MRLLNTDSLKLHYFVDNIPVYVILSHTWGEEEVLFDDIGRPDVSSMAGYAKISHCCRQAKEDGFSWAWIDTCCIDKKSSSELSEAINSMYKWYWDAAVCYAYLADVDSIDDPSTSPYHRYSGGRTRENFEASRWFTRGWTLQELLAPEIVEFYDQTWARLGSRTRLVDDVARASNIDKRYLLNRRLISSTSIAARFSWASRRKTTRPEDMAYCLLGLMGINMPMLYGEGEVAFYRLQLELIKQTNEHTIFAWQARGSPSHVSQSSILARSPEPFQSSANVRSLASSEASTDLTFEMTNNGLRIHLPCIPISQDRMVAILDCETDDGERLGIWLERSENGQFRRVPDTDLSVTKPHDIQDAELLEFYLKTAPDSDRQIVKGSTYTLAYEKSQIDHYTCGEVSELHVLRPGPPTIVKEYGGEEFQKLILVSHTAPYLAAYRPPYFTIFIGLYNTTPTIRCFQGLVPGYSNAFLRDWESNFQPPEYKPLLDTLTRENSNYSRDYYRAQLCCGNFVEIELRRVQLDQRLCWSVRVNIEGRPSREEEVNPAFRSPITCTQSMSLDGKMFNHSREAKWAPYTGQYHSLHSV